MSQEHCNQKERSRYRWSEDGRMSGTLEEGGGVQSTDSLVKTGK